MLLLSLMVASTAAASRPLVTAEGAVSMVSDSFSLLKDAGLFVHNQAVSVLPEETRVSYEKLINRATNQVTPVTSAAYAAVQPHASKAWSLAQSVWGIAEARTSPFLNALVIDFERRYPSQAGKIGSTLADKIVLLFVLWLLTGFVFRGSRRLVCGKRQKQVIYPTSGKQDVRASFPGKKTD